jgi:long-chain fatty acid transport protein
MRNSFAVTLGVSLLVALGVPREAFGGGLKIQDQSTRAMGMIDAFIGGADDASAIYYNPAGLTRLQGPQAIGNIYVAHADISYDGPGGSDETDGRIYVVPSGYFAMPIDEAGRWFAGIGAYSPFGLGTRWADTSLVANYVTLAEVRLVNINPTVAYAITDRLAVGVGVDYIWSRVINRYIDNQMTFGEIDMDARGDAWGYNLGLQFQATDTISLGLTYRSGYTIPYEGDVELDGWGISLGAETDFDFPAVIGAGICWQATPKLRVELAAEWCKWSTRDVQTIEVDPPMGNVVTQTDWDDSWVFMLGMEYQVNEKLTVRGGYGYNETPAPVETAEPSLPTGDTHAVSLGAGYRIRDNVTLDVAGIVSYSEERTISNPMHAPPGSEYDSIGTFLSLGVTWDF